jgi:hypothetical protein
MRVILILTNRRVSNVCGIGASVKRGAGGVGGRAAICRERPDTHGIGSVCGANFWRVSLILQLLWCFAVIY